MQSLTGWIGFAVCRLVRDCFVWIGGAVVVVVGISIVDAIPDPDPQVKPAEWAARVTDAVHEGLRAYEIAYQNAYPALNRAR
jgi:hypothetical protein